MLKKGGSGASLPEDVPWRASPSSVKPLPKIYHSPVLRVSQTPYSDYAISIMRVFLSLPAFQFSSFIISLHSIVIVIHQQSIYFYFKFFGEFCSIRTLQEVGQVRMLQQKLLVLNASYLVKHLPSNYLASRYYFFLFSLLDFCSRNQIKLCEVCPLNACWVLVILVVFFSFELIAFLLSNFETRF